LRGLVAGLLLLAPLFAGCVYRMNIQQGNYLEGRTVDQLQVGMTRSQVRYLLGTPMVPNAFDKERWDYLYYFKRGRLRKAEERHLIVYFRRTRWPVSSATTCRMPHRRRRIRARRPQSFRFCS